MNKRSLLIQLSNAVADLSFALSDDLDLTNEDRIFIENHMARTYTAPAGPLRLPRPRAQKQPEQTRPAIAQAAAPKAGSKLTDELNYDVPVVHAAATPAMKDLGLKLFETHNCLGLKV